MDINDSSIENVLSIKLKINEKGDLLEFGEIIYPLPLSE